MTQLPDIFPKGDGQQAIIPFRDAQQAIQWLRMVVAYGQVSVLTQYRGQVTRWLATDHALTGWNLVPLPPPGRVPSWPELVIDMTQRPQVYRMTNLDTGTVYAFEMRNGYLIPVVEVVAK